MKKVNLISCLVVAAFCFCIFISCKKGTDTPDRSHRLEANLVMDKSLFTSSAKERTSKDIFEIIEVTRKNEILEVKVKGGGSAASFQFIWDGSIFLSYPGGIHLLLKYDNSKQDFDSEKEMEIKVSLQKILGDRHNANDFYFNVINGSKLQTVILNPNGISTSENK